MKLIWNYLRRYRLMVAAALALTMVELTVELLQPLLIARIIDDGIMTNDLNTVVFWGSIMLLFSIIAFAAGIINSFYAAHASQYTGYDLRTDLFRRIQTFSMKNFQQFPTSSLLTRITNDVNQLQNTIFMSLRIMLRAPLLVAGSVIMALIVNWQLALVLLVAVPVLLVILLSIMKLAGRLFKKVQAGVDGVNSVVQENLKAVRLIKSYSRLTHESDRFHDASETLQGRTVKTLRIVEATMPIILLIMNVSIMVVLWFGTQGVNTGAVSVGETVAVINYITRMTGALSIFSMSIIIFSRAKASAERIGDVLAVEEEMEDGSRAVGEPAGEIDMDNVSFQYPDETRKALQGLRVHLKAGERTALLGATGSGKTTLLQLILRLYDPTQGRVLLDGKPLTSLKWKELRRWVGYVPQEAVLFSGTIAENLRWGKQDATDAEMEQVLRDAQIFDSVSELPDGLHTRIGQRGVNLSGGQKQRISIARALIRNPRILLLDDSTSALDVNTEMRLLKALDTYSCTTLMITQKLSTAMEADKVILLDNGTVEAVGSHDELLKHSELYRQIYETQAGGALHG
ncbi:ABC transporter ATP-binding protein [Alkalicoccus luteus]|uniref:ABC transporter ATP-binding protein n=1 Tax=Alkalicoccus luteus TaxID=1237094 RepID=A0A969TVL5_9BACI|nr:ABC transporter ATP-binding protein [Alkalicoccus luteus]NJP38530.1 ABC transporter ATP-binding protein [Alkalicoccus luteus]